MTCYFILHCGVMRCDISYLPMPRNIIKAHISVHTLILYSSIMLIFDEIF